MKKIILIIPCLIILLQNSAFTQWEQLSGPVGGRVDCISTSGNNIYLGTFGGVYLSTNNGMNWTNISKGVFNSYIQTIVADNNNLYVGTESNGLYVSTDNGLNWNKMENGIPSTQSIRTILKYDNYIIIGTAFDGIYVSSNNGISWIQSNSGLRFLNINALVKSGNKIFAGTGSGLYYSTNYGLKWDSIYNGLTNKTIKGLEVSGNDIYAIQGGVYRSIDNGNYWTKISDSLPYLDFIDVTENKIYVGHYKKGVFTTTNYGLLWDTINNGLPETYKTCLASSGDNLYIGTYQGILKSTNNGLIWSEIDNNLTISQINDLDTLGNYIFATVYGVGVFLSSNNGLTWKKSTNILGVSCLTISEKNIFVGTGGSGVYRSTDMGTSWTQVNNGLNTIYVLSIASYGDTIFAGTESYGGIYVSTNNGNNWRIASNGMTGISTRKIVIDGEKIFAGCENGGVFLSTNNGTNWKSINNGLLSTSIWSLEISNGNLYAGTLDLGIFKSSNYGVSWNSISNGISSEIITAISASDNIIIAGTYEKGIFLSTDYGESWIKKNQGLWRDDYRIYSLLIYNNHIYSGVLNFSLWKRSISDIVNIQSVSSEIPENYYLYQNYPNPFNPETKIKFNIPQNNFVNLSVYDLLGQKVKVLVNENLSPGTYEFSFDGLNLPSGVYFYKLDVGNFTQTKKMTLIK